MRNGNLVPIDVGIRHFMTLIDAVAGSKHPAVASFPQRSKFTIGAAEYFSFKT
jgi:hypothetical protein